MMRIRTLLVLSASALAATACNDDDPTTPDSDTGAADTDATADTADVGDTGRPDARLDADTAEDVQDDGPTRIDMGIFDTEPEDTTPDPDVVEPDPEPEPECGNGIRERGEICDGSEILAGVDCTSQGFIGGDIACTDSCVLNTDLCYDALCGDEIVSGDEECDGDIDAETTCESLGFAPGGEGVVLCGECAFDTSACENFICGNENLEDEFEACDGTVFGDESCRSLGFFDGDLDCADDCLEFDDAACVESVCGNGTVEGSEVCDGPGSVAEDCIDQSEIYIGGTLGCTEDCLAFVVDDCLLDAVEPEADTDSDGVTNDVDNCVEIANSNQLDFDANGVGNVCDEAVIFDVVDAENNLFLTTLAGEIPLLGPLDFELELTVEVATISVWFDDEGLMSSDIALTFADAAAEFDLSGLGLPIPGFESIAIDITALTIESVETAITPDTVTTYSSGDMGGPNDAWPMLVTGAAGTAGAAGTPINSEGTATTSTSDLSRFYNTYTLSVDEPTLALATISIDLVILPVDLEITGLAGEVVVGLAVDGEE